MPLWKMPKIGPHPHFGNNKKVQHLSFDFGKLMIVVKMGEKKCCHWVSNKHLLRDFLLEKGFDSSLSFPPLCGPTVVDCLLLHIRRLQVGKKKHTIPSRRRKRSPILPSCHQSAALIGTMRFISFAQMHRQRVPHQIALKKKVGGGGSPFY